MADMLKITTPLQQKGEINPTRQVPEPNAPPFNLTDVGKVNPANIPNEILQQNHGMIDKDGKPSILMNMLKDPAVTVSFLKNIYMLQEIIKLLPMNNQSFTEEIQKLFNALLIKPEKIASEMIRQENKATSFKGSLFDFLRDVINRQPDNETKLSVATLLKALNHEMNRRDILDAISNNLKYLGESLSASKNLSTRLEDISMKFKSEDAADNFTELKNIAAKILNDVEESILYNEKTAKLVSITTYNLSRFNDNKDFLKESVRNLLMMLDGVDVKNELVTKVNAFIRDLYDNTAMSLEDSEIMDVLAEIIGKQSDNAEIRMLNSENIEKIIHSLLSSPCNFTPLLHFVIPVDFMNLKSFAEVWINPDGKEDERTGFEGSNNDCIHMLIVFDIEGVGQFETELFVENKKINLFLYCPANYVETFSKIKEGFVEAISFSEYYIDEVKVDKLERTRSLLEVFKSLPYKRTGIDVRI